MWRRKKCDLKPREKLSTDTAAASAAKSLQSCPTLCDPIDVSPPGSPAPGILQARTLEWVAISFSNAWKYKVKVKLLSRVRPLATPWTAAYQAPPSMGFSRQEYWSGVPLSSPRLRTTKNYCSMFSVSLCDCFLTWALRNQSSFPISHLQNITYFVSFPSHKYLQHTPLLDSAVLELMGLSGMRWNYSTLFC